MFWLGRAGLLGKRMPLKIPNRPLRLATRGSALALALAHWVGDCLRGLLPGLRVEARVFKTGGDWLQGKAEDEIPGSLPKGLFTKELENALLAGDADLAVHSLKDLPIDLPAGLCLAAVSFREDARDVLLTKRPIEVVAEGENPLCCLPPGAVVGTGSSRRRAFLLAAGLKLRVVSLRGNVPTRIRKLADSSDLDGVILAAAGLKRLGYVLREDRDVEGGDVPPNIFAALLPVECMIPCAAQGAVGLETRLEDSGTRSICRLFNDVSSQICVEAERRFLQAMGGGCQSPLAAYGQLVESSLRLMVAKPLGGSIKILEGTAGRNDGDKLGMELASKMQSASREETTKEARLP